MAIDRSILYESAQSLFRVPSFLVLAKVICIQLLRLEFPSFQRFVLEPYLGSSSSTLKPCTGLRVGTVSQRYLNKETLNSLFFVGDDGKDNSDQYLLVFQEGSMPFLFFSPW